MLDYGTVEQGLLPNRLNYNFANFFYNCDSLIEAPELPNTTLKGHDYYSMFYGCSSLTTLPELPSITLKTNCYALMFAYCSSITSVPENYLPAMILAGGTACYDSMFAYCTSLVSIPTVMAATSMMESCYTYMFSNCPLIEYIPEFPTVPLRNNCYQNMFWNCAALIVNTSPSPGYSRPWSVPKNYSSVSLDGTNSRASMLSGTGGTAPSTPVFNTVYYTKDI